MDPLRRLLARLRAGRRAAASAPQSDAGPPAPDQKTGQTVFDDVPLRFRSLTVAHPDFAKLQEPGGAPGAFKIRLAGLSNYRRAAGTLVERRYASRGYRSRHGTEDPDLYTFIAYDEGVLAGTVSVRLDGGNGLAADALYGAEIDALRAEGARLCEFTRLAVDVKAASKPVLAGLFHTAYLYAAHVRGYSHAVIEVNPRHVAFYRRALAFEPLGGERMNPRVQAPGVLLAVSFAEIAQGLAAFAGRPGSAATERSLFPYGFDRDEEAGILQRLRALERG